MADGKAPGEKGVSVGREAPVVNQDVVNAANRTDLTVEERTRAVENARAAEQEDVKAGRERPQPRASIGLQQTHPEPAPGSNRSPDTMDGLARAKTPEDPEGEPESPKGQKIKGMGAGEAGRKVKEAIEGHRDLMHIGADLGESKYEPSLEQKVENLHAEALNSSMGYRRRHTRCRDDNRRLAEAQRHEEKRASRKA